MPKIQDQLNLLHEQEFTSLLRDAPSDVVWARVHSCVGPTTRAWLLARLSTFSFRLFFAHLFITLHICFNIPHPIVVYFSKCQCCHTIDDLDIHLLCYPCENEPIATHDMLRDTIVTIASKSGVLSPHTKMSGYCNHQRQFSNPSEHYHCWFNSYKFGAICFNNNACNDSCLSRQNMILHIVNVTTIVKTWKKKLNFWHFKTPLFIYLL